MERPRCAKAVEDMTVQWGGQLAVPQPPTASRQLGGRSCPGNKAARSAEPYTARSRWDPAAGTAQCTSITGEAREALTRQCHVLPVNHTGHFSIRQFSKRWEAHPVALSNKCANTIMTVLCASEGQKGWSALE